MSRMRYLADTSVYARLTKPPVRAAFALLAAEGRVALCAPVAFELGYSARSHDDYLTLADRLLAFPPVPATDADHRRALEVQALLSARGQPRALSLVDALVAAIAETRGLTSSTTTQTSSSSPRSPAKKTRGSSSAAPRTDRKSSRAVSPASRSRATPRRPAGRGPARTVPGTTHRLGKVSPTLSAPDGRFARRPRQRHPRSIRQVHG